MAKGKSNNMNSLFGGFTAPTINTTSTPKEEIVEKTELKKVAADEVKQEEKKEKKSTVPVEKKELVKNAEKTYAGEDRGISLRLAEEIDETYLDVVAIQKGIPKKQFLANIMIAAVNEARNIKPKDIDYNEPFRKDVKLKCKQVTILLPTDLYEDVVAMSKKYGMATARYIAWSVQKARLNDPDWN